MLRLIITGLLSATLLYPMAGQMPQIVHGQVSTQASGLNATLDSLRSSAEPVWIGYSIPTNMPYTDGWNRSHVTYLENDRYVQEQDELRQQSKQTDRAVLLLRVAGGAVDKVRSAAAEEQLDAGGRKVIWLDHVSPEESVATLKRLVQAAGGGQVLEGGVFLIALHRSDAAVPALVSLTAADSPEHLREQAAFWLATQRGPEGLRAIEDLTHNLTDQNAHFREKLTFDLTLSKEPGALPELIRMAHEDPAPGVRRQAQFWMATRGGTQVTGPLRQAADHDADAETRRHAVFAISRLPESEATTQLCALAETSRDPEVRKQAVFWLGQSPDPKALDYLTRLLQRPARP